MSNPVRTRRHVPALRGETLKKTYLGTTIYCPLFLLSVIYDERHYTRLAPAHRLLIPPSLSTRLPSGNAANKLPLKRLFIRLFIVSSSAVLVSEQGGFLKLFAIDWFVASSLSDNGMDAIVFLRFFDSHTRARYLWIPKTNGIRSFYIWI